MGAEKYDLIFTKSGVDYSFMLRQEGRTKDWLVGDAPLLPQTLITESASPANIDPQREIQVSQVDWRKGFQDLMLDDDQKYYDSENCDARLKGKVTLSSKKLSAISWASAPSTPTITNAGMENWAGAGNLSDWTEAGNAPVEENTTKHGGSASAKWTSGLTGTITQEIIGAGSIANYKGMLVTAKVWGYVRDYTDCYIKVKLDDGDTNTTGSAPTSDDTWEQVGATHRISASATKLDLVVMGSAAAADYAMADDVSFTLYPANASGATVDMVEFGDDIVAAVGKNLYTIGASSTTLKANFEYDLTKLCVFENRLYIAQGWSATYWYTSDLATFTEFTDETLYAKYMANIGGGTFIAADSNSTLKSSVNPINSGTAFSSVYQVDSDDHDITGLVDHEDTWFVRKEDDVYYLSGSDVLSLAGLDSEASTTYTYKIHKWGDNLYMGSGTNSFYEYDVSASTISTISPTRYAQGDANYDEEILAITHDETYLYVAIDNGSDIRILAGRTETVDGDTDWWWHPLYTLSSHNDITAMLVSSLTGSKRWYVATDTETDGVIPFFVSVGYAEPYTESGYECQSSGTFYTPWYRGNFPTEDKYWKSVDITSICCTDKTSITPSYQIKGGSWTALTACSTSAYSGGYPAETTDSRDIDQTSERIRFKFAMAAAVDEYTPILYGTGGGIVAYAKLQPTEERRIIATIQLAPQIRLRDNTTEERVVSTDLTNLRGLYTGGGTMTITGPDETSYTVSFARDGYEEQLAYDKTMRQEVYWVTCKLLED